MVASCKRARIAAIYSANLERPDRPDEVRGAQERISGDALFAVRKKRGLHSIHSYDEAAPSAYSDRRAGARNELEQTWGG
jgi:hypothetical protein